MTSETTNEIIVLLDALDSYRKIKGKMERDLIEKSEGCNYNFEIELQTTKFYMLMCLLQDS